MEYNLVRIGRAWVIFSDGGVFEEEVFSTSSFPEALAVLGELRSQQGE